MSLTQLFAAQAAASVAIEPTAAADAYTLTAGRFWSLVAAALGLTGAVIGGVVLARGRRVGTGTGGRGAVVALVTGLAGAVIGGGVVLAADGGPGTGYGIVGGYLAVVIGLVALVLGGLAQLRSRHTT